MPTVLIRNQKGIPIEKVLTKNMIKYLQDKRYLYVVSANFDNIGKKYTDKRIYKFGEGHTQSRLRDYIYYYGRHLKSNPYSGVKIHYLYTIKYTESDYVQKKNTKILKMELKLKRHYRNSGEVVPYRGTERVRVVITDLFKVIESRPMQDLKDEKTINPHRTRSRDNTVKRTDSGFFVSH